MDKKTWYKLGLIFSIIFYSATSSLAIINYYTALNTFTEIIYEGQTLDEFVRNEKPKPIEKIIATPEQLAKFRAQRNTILILNPFWVGIVIFSVLLKKTITKQTRDKLI